MSLFQCQHCGCLENTALSSQGCDGFAETFFDWTGLEDRRGKKLCSACAPTKFSDDTPSGLGQWHGRFERVFLPMGKYKQDRETGNLLTKEIERLRNDLTAARLELENAEGRLAGYMRDNDRLRWDISRLNMRCEAMGWRLYPHSDPAREAVAGDIGWPVCDCGPECMGPDNTHLICKAECGLHPSGECAPHNEK